MLSQEDIEFLATVKAKTSQTEILKMYVQNWAELDLKQRRRILGKINSMRAMHAKEIFLKELGTLGNRMGSKSGDYSRKDPLLMQLEGITG